MWGHLGIRQKIFVLFMLLVLVPLITINIIWLRSSQVALKKAAANRQSILLTSSAQRVNESLDSMIKSVISHSQEQSVIDLDKSQAGLYLLQFASQDKNIRRITLANSNGDEEIVVKNHALDQTLHNIKNSDAFRVVTQASNEAYVSDTKYDQKRPYITVSVPILSSNRLGDQNLSNAEALARRFGADTKGALIVDISLDTLWQSLLSAKLGSDGYVYLVNIQGMPIAYRDQAFIAHHPTLANIDEVKNAIKVLSTSSFETTIGQYRPTPTPTISETGVKVLSSSYPISRAGWAIIGEEPLSSVYAAVNKVKTIALVIFLASVPATIGLVLLATRSIIKPVHELTAGAVRIGEGDFKHPLAIKGHDELAVLANTFNKMGEDLDGLINRYREQNIDLNSERTKLQAVLDTIADGVVVLDSDFNIVLVNKPILQLIGQPSSTAVHGHPWLKVFPIVYHDKPFDNHQLAGELLHFKELILPLDDQQKYLDLTTVQLPLDSTGIAYILTVHDITESRELENMKLDFVSMAAHELRTPLTAVHGYLELIAGDKSYTGTTRQYVERALSVADRLAGLINNLLSLSRIERRSLKLNITQLDWTAIVESEIKNHGFAADAKHIRIESRLPTEPIAVAGDELALREVIGNLIGNALHYTKDGGTVTVSVETSEAGVKTTISDTGIGISTESIGKLFTKYYRAQGGLTTSSQGTGIGLFISKSIVESHQGSIGVHSIYGQGSDFYFILPRLEQTSHPIASTNAIDQSVDHRSKIDWF